MSADRGKSNKHVFRSVLTVVVLGLLFGFREVRLEVANIPTSAQAGLSSFFKAVDGDGDGEIELHEAEEFLAVLGGSDFDDAHEISAGADNFLDTVDSTDSGSTISAKELEAHLSGLMTGENIVQWVIHGLHLPQYAEAFRQNAITALDFPLLVQSNTLEEDLGVHSKLHRKQIIRAVQRRILGAGSVPDPPHSMACKAVGSSGIAIQWENPTHVGNPPAHGYSLWRRNTTIPVWSFHQSGEVHQDLEEGFVDEAARAGEHYDYKLYIWGGFGPSAAAQVKGCAARGGRGLGAGGEPEAGWMEWALRGVSSFVVVGLGVLMRGSQFSAILKKLLGMERMQAVNRHMGSYMTTLMSPIHSIRRSTSHLSPPISPQSIVHEGYRYIRKTSLTLANGLAGNTARSALSDRRGNIGPSPLEVRHTEQFSGSEVIPLGTSAGGIAAEDPNHITMTDAWVAANQDPAAMHGQIQRVRRGSSTGDLDKFEPHSRNYSDENVAGMGMHKLSSSSLEALDTESAKMFHNSGPGLQMNDVLVQQFAAMGEQHGVMPPAPPSPPNVNVTGFTARAYSKNMCAAPGCDARWDRYYKVADLKMLFKKHYCKVCQKAYCENHTRISPHGSSGQCGMDSQCFCQGCYDDQDAKVKQVLEVTNKLVHHHKPPLHNKKRTSLFLGGDRMRSGSDPGSDDWNESIGSDETGGSESTKHKGTYRAAMKWMYNTKKSRSSRSGSSESLGSVDLDGSPAPSNGTTPQSGIVTPEGSLPSKKSSKKKSISRIFFKDKDKEG